MGAVLMRLRAEARARWRAWLALALAFGIAGGAATAAAAGARRTDSAYPRFVEEHESFHVLTGGLGEVGGREGDRIRRALVSLPQVEDYGLGQFVTTSFELPSGGVLSFPEALVLADPSGREMFSINRARILDGRMFDPARADEAVAEFTAAERYGLRVGDRLDILLFDPETFRTTIRRPVTIVGVVVAPGNLPAVGQVTLSGLTVSPAFLEENARFIPPNEDGPSIRLRGGVDQIDEYVQAARAIAPTLDFPVEINRHVQGVRTTLRFDVGALWILALLIGLSALVILGQALSRHLWLQAGENEPLDALGFGRRQMIMVDLLRAAVLGIAAAVTSVGVAIGLSPLLPRGLARVVEPAPGLDADWLVLGLGAAVTLVVPALASIVPSLRAARRRTAYAARPSRLAGLVTAAGAGPSAVAGTRLALEPGRGTRAIPVRATIGGVAIALAAFTAAGSFTESLDGLIARPELYGYGWDVFAGSDDPGADSGFFEDDPDVETFTPGGYANVLIGGKQLIPLVYEPGTIEPTMLSGEAPRTAHEIALGNALMRRLGLAIGDTVEVWPSEREDERAGLRFTVVGTVVVPPVFFQQVEPGESVAMTMDGMVRLSPEDDDGNYPYLIKYEAGVDVGEKVRRLRADHPDVFIGQVREPGAELAALSRSSGLPVVLTAVLLLMGVATLVHTLGSSIRKRRRDLAVLKTLGFVRRQVRATVAWQASTLAVAALVVGVPLGLVAGRQAWRWFAETLGVVPAPVTPVLIAVAVVAPATVVIANLIAALPARAASRTQPAVVFRSE